MPQVVAARPTQYHYPTVDEARVIVSKPEPVAEPAPRQKTAAPESLEQASKADLIKLLLAQLAKERDLEKQAQ